MKTKTAKMRAAGPAVKPVNARQIVEAVDGQIERVRTGPAYQLGLLLAVVVLLILPLVYLGLIALVGYGVYWHAVSNVGVLESVGGRGAVLAYFGPIVVGGIVLLFMIKPLLARRVNESVPLTLRREDEPVLFEFIDRLCQMVGAPTPARIDVDLDVNASAGFRGGWAGVLGGELVLTFGLPLPAGLNTRQFAGVLAHELGHFAQGSGMRLSYIVRRINGWFARIVYQRDRWDRRLSALSRQDHPFLMIVCWMTLAMVWLSRRILWCLMMAAHAATSFLLRQMEFDADRHECRAVGSEVFDSTSSTLRCLGAATGAAFSDLGLAWRERRLCDDLPGLIKARQNDMPAAIRTALLEAGKERKTRWFDSHPSDADRSASAQREGAAGLFKVEAPATILFTNFAELSRIATMLFYRKSLGAAFRPGQLTRTENMVAERAEVVQTFDARDAYFRGLIDAARPVFPDRLPDRPKDPDGATERLLELRSTLLELEPAARKAAEQFTTSRERAAMLAAVKELRTAGIQKSGAKDATLDTMNDEALAAAESRAREENAFALAHVERAINVAMERLHLALSLAPSAPEPVQTDETDEGGDYELADEPKAGSGDLLLGALTVMRPAAQDVSALWTHMTSLGLLLGRVKGSGNSKPLVDTILWHSRKASELLREIHQQLGNIPYPYVVNGRRLTLAAYIVNAMPPYKEVGNVCLKAKGAIDAYRALYMRIISDLASRAQKIEAELGLPPLNEVSNSAT